MCDTLRCDDCRKIYEMKSEVAGEEIEPPCQTCFPSPRQANEKALMIYQQVQHQLVIAEMSGQVIDLKWDVVLKFMEAYNVRNQRDCIKRIRIIFNYLMEHKYAR